MSAPELNAADIVAARIEAGHNSPGDDILLARLMCDGTRPNYFYVNSIGQPTRKSAEEVLFSNADSLTPR